MKPYVLPEPSVDSHIEAEIWRLLQKGFEANRWRSDFDQWTQKRLWAERHQKRLVATLQQWIGPLSGKRVLDLGTGRGGGAVAMQAAGAHVTALDLRHRNLRITQLRASRYGVHIPRLRAVGEALPFAPSTFDLVVCKDVLEHCTNPMTVLAEIARVLAPSGAAYVTFINKRAWIDPHYKLPAINFLPAPIAERVINTVGRKKHNIRDLQRLSDMHYYTLAQAKNLCAANGLNYQDVTLARLTSTEPARLRRFAHDRLSLGFSTLEAILTPA